MKRSHSQFPTVVVISCLMAWLARDALVAQERPVPPAIAGWEYKMLSGDEVSDLGEPNIRHELGGFYTGAQEKGLNKLGEEKWELVTVQTVGGANFWYFFKRPKTVK